MLSVGVLLGTLVTGLGQGADPERSAETAVANLTVYPGLEAVLFASEPLIASPTNIDVDERGRVWVCEVQNYRGHGARDQRPEGDRILILEDTNGDGVSDRTKVFYQGRDVDAALGICVFDGRVIVTCAPNVIVFTDADGDDVPDSKSYLFTQTGRPQNDHSTHSVVFGPDGHLYWNMGNGGAYVHDADGRLVRDQFGQPVLDRRIAGRDPAFAGIKSSFWGGMVFRCDLNGEQFEVLGHNFRNNYEVTVDSFGNPWQSDNDDDGNYGVRLNYILEYGNYGYLEEYSGAGWRVPRVSAHPEIASRHWHQNDPGVVPNWVQTGAGSPTGITVYEGDLLPERFWGRVLHCDAGPGVLHAADSRRVGDLADTEMVNLVSTETDKWFRPVDVAVAPDGSLFLSDWYDPVVGWNRQADLQRGRIFRIAPPGHQYAVPDFDFTTPAGAVEALKSPAYSVRAKAWLRLQAFGSEAEEALLALRSSENPWYQARAYWLLAADADRGGVYVDEAMQSIDPRIRTVGLRAAVRYGHPLLDRLRQLVRDPEAAVRRECAVTLRRIDPGALPELWAVLAEQYDGENRWYLEALGIAAEGRWDQCLSQWFGGAVADYEDPAVRQILWRSRSAATAGHLGQMLRSVVLTDEEVNRLLRAFDFQADSEAKTRELWALAEGDGLGEATSYDERIRFEAMTRLIPVRAQQGEALTALARRLVQELTLPPYRIELIRQFELRDQADVLVSLVMDSGDVEIEAQALAALFGLGAEATVEAAFRDGDPGEWVPRLVASGNGGARPFLLQALLDTDCSQAVREMALRGLIQSREGANAVLDLARSGDFPEALEVAAGQAFSQTLHVMNRDAAAELFPVPALKGDEPLPQMTELLVYVGNAEKGRQLFESATCAQCHSLASAGVGYGPNLAGIGAKLSKQGLYESILDPSASVSPSYQGIEVNLNSGDSLAGLRVSQTDEAVVINLLGSGLRTVPRRDIAELRELDQSVMPAGLQQQLSFDELVDLVEFLASLKAGPTAE